MKISVGFELEAGVKGELEAKRTARSVKWKTGGDGSIRIRRCGYPLEFKSKVYLMKKDFKHMEADFKKISKTISEINSSMGLHIHVSFSDKITYCRLSSYKFVRKFQSSYKRKFTKIGEQRRMNNSYCRFYPSKKQFEAEIKGQLRYGNSKYRAINFGAFSEHRTFEFRIFPATKDVREFKRYVNFVIETISLFLKKNKKANISPDIKNFMYKYRLKSR